MKHLLLTLALLFALSMPCSAVTLFTADYDGDGWGESKVNPSVGCADTSPYTGEAAGDGDEWLPLRELSETLPYSVGWDDTERCVTVRAYGGRSWAFYPDWWLPEGMIIREGVTYVTPAFLRRFLPGISFIYAGELYVFDGETVRSQLVRGSTDFREHTLTVLYRLRLALPEDYQLIRNSLTGGIEETVLPERLPYSTLAYVYPTKARPTAHIVANRSGANLAELIAHEAYHVHLTRRVRDSEENAREYGRRVKADLLKIT